MNWDGIRGTFAWLVVLLLVTVVSTGAAGMHLWAIKDDLLATEVRKKLEGLSPDLLIEADQIHLRDGRRLELSNVTIHSRTTQTLLARIPRYEATLDEEMLREHRRIVLSEVVIDSPEIYAVRDVNGRWSFQGIAIPPPTTRISPRIQINSAKLHCGIQSAHDGSVRFISANGISIHCDPNAYKRYNILGTGVSDELGPINLTGIIDANTGQWKLSGNVNQFQVNEALVDLAGQFSPAVQQQVAQVRTKAHAIVARTQGHTGEAPTKTAALTDPSLNHASAAPSSLLRADVSLDFEIGQTSKEAPLDYRIHTDIQHGHISELLLPVALYDLEGAIELSRTGIRVKKLHAANGNTELFIDGVAQRINDEWLHDFLVKANNLQLDSRIRPFLNEALRTQYDLIKPEGTFDLDVSLKRDSNAAPQMTLRRFDALNCRVQHQLFPYPVHDVNGSIKQVGDAFEMDFTGIAGETPLTFTGRNTPGKEGRFLVELKHLPVNEMFVNSFVTPSLESTKRALEDLKLKGSLSGSVEFLRNQQTAGRFKTRVKGTLSDGTCDFKGFPYAVTGLTGEVNYDPLVENVWSFDQLRGRHGDGLLKGRAALDLSTNPSLFAMSMELVRIPVDHSLKHACVTANQHLGAIWDDFKIGGTVDVEELKLGWIPGHSPQVTLSGIQWKDGTITPKAMPYSWDNVVGALEWDGQRLKIHSLHGWHGHTYLHIDGTTKEKEAFIDTPVSADIAWRVHFGDLKIIKLIPNEELQRALPISLAKSLEAFALKDSVDVHAGIDMKGWTRDDELITAQWWSLTTFKDNAFFAGTPIEHATGKVKVLNGEWNGERVKMDGYVDFDSAHTVMLPLTKIRGPFALNGNRLTVGTPQFSSVPTVHSPDNKYRGKQLTANLYSGLVALDVETNFSERPQETEYQVEINAKDVELAEWAADQKIQGTRLMGKVNGTLNLKGRGPSETAPIGDGWVQVTPAALYELPVFAQVFSLLNFKPIENDKTAFNYAYSDFTVHDGLFDFQQIELVGEPMRLVGRGYVGYAGPKKSTLEFDFYSKANNRIPLLRPIIESFGSNWVRVQILGTVSQPMPLIQPRVPILDDAFRGFMTTFEGGPRRRPTQPPRVNQ